LTYGIRELGFSALLFVDRAASGVFWQCLELQYPSVGVELCLDGVQQSVKWSTEHSTLGMKQVQSRLRVRLRPNVSRVWYPVSAVEKSEAQRRGGNETRCMLFCVYGGWRAEAQSARASGLACSSALLRQILFGNSHDPSPFYRKWQLFRGSTQNRNQEADNRKYPYKASIHMYASSTRNLLMLLPPQRSGASCTDNFREIGVPLFLGGASVLLNSNEGVSRSVPRMLRLLNQ